VPPDSDEGRSRSAGALTAVEGVNAAAVVGVPDPLRGEEVKAYIVLASGLPATDRAAADLLAEVARHLAPFKVPRYVEFVDDLPLTPSGKVAKADLRKRNSSSPRGFDRVDNVWREGS
jgi:acyl-coenzyme A synthetase/AMP-(fatty) acid ligase